MCVGLGNDKATSARAHPMDLGWVWEVLTARSCDAERLALESGRPCQHLHRTREDKKHGN
eukprot:2770850-Amphidinium_carterae.1